MSKSTWPLILLGAVATAAVIGVVAFVGGFGGDEPDPDPAASSSQAPEPSEPATTASEAPSEAPSSSAADVATALYFIGDTERGGPRLYREFQTGTGEPLAAAIDLLTGTPKDPDYRTAWPEGSLSPGGVDGEVITVNLDDPALQERPADMDKATARAAVQQVVYTAQAAVQQRTPVWFMVDGEVAQTVYGVPTADPVGNGSILQHLSHMNITTPEQGAGVSGTLELTGVANSFEASAGWELRQGDKVVKKGPWMADGWMEDKLFPFEVSVDLAGVAPGDYTIWATTDDPTGGTEGSGAMTDSKDITIE